VAGQDIRRRRWDRRATRYDTSGVRLEQWMIGDGRAWVCSRARGLTLEVAIGTGRNLSLYGDEVELTGVDLSPGMLDVARRRAAELGRAVELREGEAERLPFPNDTFDTVVCTLAICAVADRSAALAEMYRVLRPSGALLLLDHAQWRWLWSPRPADLAVREGFIRESRERTRLGLIERLAARKPLRPT
jgi:ubiquinone/menaquinone biosynthesis C-methylase UbiE